MKMKKILLLSFIFLPSLVLPAEREEKEVEEIPLSTDDFLKVEEPIPKDFVKKCLEFYDALPGETREEKANSHIHYSAGKSIRMDALTKSLLDVKLESAELERKHLREAYTPDSVGEYAKRTVNEFLKGGAQGAGLEVGHMLVHTGAYYVSNALKSSEQKKRDKALAMVKKMQEDRLIFNRSQERVMILAVLLKQVDNFAYTKEQKQAVIVQIKKEMKKAMQEQYELFGIALPPIDSNEGSNQGLDLNNLDNLIVTDLDEEEFEEDSTEDIEDEGELGFAAAE